MVAVISRLYDGVEVSHCHSDSVNVCFIYRLKLRLLLLLTKYCKESCHYVSILRVVILVFLFCLIFIVVLLTDHTSPMCRNLGCKI